jgi:predicted secreted protein
MTWRLLLLALLASTAARAQPPAETRLVIEATGSAQATPDELGAVLASQQTGRDPARLQQAVNAALAAALRETARISAIQPRLLGYDTSEDANHGWTASGRIALRSGDSIALLDLIGRLQASGLVLQDLSWALSPALARREEAAATRDALTAPLRRAGDAASSLGLRVDHIAEVQVDEVRDGSPRPMAAMRSMLAVAPSAPSAPMSVDVTASATVILRP